MVVRGRLERHELGIERGIVNDDRLGAQVEHGTHVERVVVRPRDSLDGMIRQSSRHVGLVPAAAGHGIVFVQGEIVDDVVHRDVLIRTPDDVLHLCIVERCRVLSQRGLPGAKERRPQEARETPGFELKSVHGLLLTYSKTSKSRKFTPELSPCVPNRSRVTYR